MDQQPHDPGLDLRVSHDDRDRVADQLRVAAGDGRLDIDELEQRLEQAYAAKTYRDLRPLVADLPGARTDPPGAALWPRSTASAGLTPVGGTATHHRSQAVLAERKRRGAWVVPGAYTATAILGNVELDLREASFEQREVVLTCTSLVGEIIVLVAEDVTVVDDVDSILGECKLRSRRGAPPPPGGPVLRVRGNAVLGSVNVYRLPAGQSRHGMYWQRLLRHGRHGSR